VSYTDTSLKGTVDAKEAGLLFLSVPYDDGWAVTVDGQPAQPESIGGGAGSSAMGDEALMALRLGPGRHEISMKYQTKGLWQGVAVTLVAALALAFATLSKRLIWKLRWD